MAVLPHLNKGVRSYLKLRGVRSEQVQVGGHALHHYALAGSGKGPPVVLVHGLAGSANGFFKTFFALSQRFSHVYAPDLPGNGFSPLPDGGRGLGARGQLQVLQGFMDAVVEAPAFVIGNSLGGAMAAQLAQSRPDRVRALGLISPAGARVARDRLEALYRDLRVEDVAKARALTRRLFHKTPWSSLLLAADMRLMYDTPSVRAVLEEFTPDDCLEPEALGRLAMPTLLVWGKSERLLPYEGVDYFRQHLPAHAEVYVVEGFGHVPQMERPAELVRLLTGFADRAGL